MAKHIQVKTEYESTETARAVELHKTWRYIAKCVMAIAIAYSPAPELLIDLISR